jgi:hypothetical protein
MLLLGIQSSLLDDFKTFKKEFNVTFEDSNKKQTSTNKL